jgi:hypothetical protein
MRMSQRNGYDNMKPMARQPGAFSQMGYDNISESNIGGTFAYSAR